MPQDRLAHRPVAQAYTQRFLHTRYRQLSHATGRRRHTCTVSVRTLSFQLAIGVVESTSRPKLRRPTIVRPALRRSSPNARVCQSRVSASRFNSHGISGASLRSGEVSTQLFSCCDVTYPGRCRSMLTRLLPPSIHTFNISDRPAFDPLFMRRRPSHTLPPAHLSSNHCRSPLATTSLISNSSPGDSLPRLLSCNFFKQNVVESGA
jgi:hypothetical protein